MTLVELNTFCKKFKLLSASRYQPTAKSGCGTYIPYQIQYMFSDYDFLEIAKVQVELSNDKITDVILKFKTRVLYTSTLEEACNIFETDFLPKIKYRKMYDRLKKMEGDFDT